MKLFIRATGNISPQKTFGQSPLLEFPVEQAGNRLAAVEPDYKSFIDVKLIRRMSRIIKMGVAAAMECLQQAGVAVPDAIVTGTAYGCLDDTRSFLSKMVEQEEELLTPTAFIQSTHNTVGAQIALMLHCNGYNNVFVHRAFSFESALQDAMMLLQEDEAKNVLVGGLDEITGTSHAILSRFGLYKQQLASNLHLFRQKSKGTIAGEGAAFFLLTGEASGNDLARFDGLFTFYKPKDIAETQANIEGFLSSQSLAAKDIDLLITGRNGDIINDAVYDQLGKTVFNSITSINYKHLCGEYPTSSAFALWLGTQLLSSNEMPAVLNYSGQPAKKLRKILVYNHWHNTHHSLLLISAC